jgi:5-methylcytosine-specific restriction endonuclease McrA
MDQIKHNKHNSLFLGQESDLESFLFGSSRQALTDVAKGLRKISPYCHYCGERVRDDANVDHFIPRVIYPRDLIHNFVLAHKKCNSSKSFTLAAKNHVNKWINFVDSNLSNLDEIA